MNLRNDNQEFRSAFSRQPACNRHGCHQDSGQLFASQIEENRCAKYGEHDQHSQGVRPRIAFRARMFSVGYTITPSRKGGFHPQGRNPWGWPFPG